MNKDKIAEIIDISHRENPCGIEVRYNEPMKEHTTFKAGGNADCWICPDGEGFTHFCAALLNRAKNENIPVFILGGGANIVVSDKGIRGIVLDMGAWNSQRTKNAMFSEQAESRVLCEENFIAGSVKNYELVLKSGTNIDEAAGIAADAALSGLEFLAGMPGTIGGAVWMNARCYGKEMSDVLQWVEFLVNDGSDNKEYVVRKMEITTNSRLPAHNFGYKLSPFQKMDCLILNAAFKLKKGDKEKILADMNKNRKDRQDKGHYLFPCAGSAFKNNHEFGKPTGQIIDELGLKGIKKGGAEVASFHGNIIINSNNASASDIRALTCEVAARVKAARGFKLKTEILFVGEW